MKRLKYFFIIISLVIPLELRAEMFKLHIENDFFGGTDRHYTHATRLDYVFDQDHIPSPLRLLKKNPLFPLQGNHGYLSGEEDNFTFGLFLAQYIYTPSDITLEVPPPDDRPYAGWLYTGYQSYRTLNSDNNKDSKIFESGDQFSLSFGVVGESSKAGDVQSWVHEVIGDDEPMGWDYQVEETFAIDMMYNYFCKLGIHQKPYQGFGIEFLPYVGGNIGNVFIQGRIGGKIRVGYNLPYDFGVFAITPSKITPELQQNKKEERWDWFGFNIFFGAEGRYVLYNLLIEGDTPLESQDLELENWVGDLIVGASLQFFRRVTLDYMLIERSKEFVGQEDSHRFGSISLSYQF